MQNRSCGVASCVLALAVPALCPVGPAAAQQVPTPRLLVPSSKQAASAAAPAPARLVPDTGMSLARTAKALPLSVGAVHRSGMPTIDVAAIGDSVTVDGTGLDGVTGVVLIPALRYGDGTWHADASKTSTYTATATRVTSAAIDFVLPDVPAGPGAAYFVRVSKGSASVTTAGALQVMPRRLPHKITSVVQDVVRAGGRIRVSGVGFDSGGVSVSGAYFGLGTPNSPSNPLFAVANRSDTGVDVILPQGCDQQGILLLSSPNATGDPTLVGGDQPIVVGCAPSTPSGRIAGSESVPNGVVIAQPGSTVTVNGTALRYVTRVTDTQNRTFPFTYQRVGSQVSGFEQLSVTLPAGRGQLYSLRLENRLTDPIAPGTVTGTVQVPAAPTWSSIAPGWAEAGQKVRISGRDLSFGRAPSVTVGGTPAQVLAFDPLWVEVRLGAGTAAGPVVLSNDGGSMTASGTPTTTGATPQPEFFVVSGPSVVQGVQSSTLPLANGAMLTVTGQNLARLGGICLDSNGQVGKPAGYFPLRRINAGGALEVPAQATSNTVMRVAFNDLPTTVRAGSAIQLYAPTTPPGDSPPSTFACVPSGASLAWTF